MSTKESIPCAHDGGMFQFTVPNSGNNSRGWQHSPGCVKTTKVYSNNGVIIRTTT
jgi:hypothetical protein